MTEYTGFSLGDGKGISAAENEQTEKLPMNIDVFYETFIEGNERARDFEEIFKHKTESYIAVGLKPFEDPDEKARIRIKALEKEYLNEAELRWGRTKGDQIPVFQNAIATLLPLFTNEKKYRLMFKPSLVEFTKEKYTEAIRAKCLNGNKIDSIEMVQLLEQAEQIGLVNNENERKEIIVFIKEYAEKNGYAVNSYKDDFIEEIKKFDEKDFIETDANIANLLSIFSKYKKNDINDEKDYSQEELLNLMMEVLDEIGIKFVNKIEAFENQVFNKFNFDASKPIDNETYFTLKITAKNEYGFSNEEFDQFFNSKKLGLENVPEKQKLPEERGKEMHSESTSLLGSGLSALKWW